jgi:hypothetical protein
MQRRKVKHLLSLSDRLSQGAARWRQEAEKLPPGSPERHELERKARQADTAAHVGDWLKSPGLQSPKP